MKFLAAVFAVVSFSSCTHLTLNIAGYDKKAGTVTIEGNQLATKQDFQLEADKYCGKKATLIKMVEIKDTSKESTKGISEVSLKSFNTDSVPIKKYQYIFKCN